MSIKLRTYYMDRAVFNLAEVIEGRGTATIVQGEQE